MAGVDNLLKAEDLTSDELRSRAKKGGIASGKARREKKLFRETLETILSMSMKDGECVSVDDIKSFANIKGQNISVQEAIIIAQIQKAMKGDTRAAEYVRDSIGQKPSDKVQLEADVSMSDKMKEVEGYIKGKWSDEQ